MSHSTPQDAPPSSEPPPTTASPSMRAVAWIVGVTVVVLMGIGGAQVVLLPVPSDEAPATITQAPSTSSFVLGFVVVVQLVALITITRISRAQRRAEEELVTARLRAEAAARTKADFLANMSHELRTPLNGVLGMTDLLAQTELDDEQTQYVEHARLSGKSLQLVIDDLLTVTELEGENVALEPIEFQLRDVVEDVAAIVAPGAAEKGLEVVARVARELPERVVGDAKRLRQVLLHLAGNAVKFTFEGEVCLFVRPEPDGIDEGKLGVRFEIVDSGLGLPPDKIAALFRPFEQAENSFRRRHGGMGLGLTITSRLVQLLGGRLNVRSQQGKGTTIAVSLPFENAGRMSLRTPPAVLASSALRVLIVDDHWIAQETWRAHVDDLGCSAVTVAGSGEALAIVAERATGAEPIDVALIDRELGRDDDGLELARQLYAQFGISSALMGVTADQLADQDDSVVLNLLKPLRFDDVERALARLATTPRPRRSSAAPSESVEPGVDEASPVEPASAVEPPAPLPAPAAPERATVDAPNVRVLVVEDNLVNQRVVGALLKKIGVEFDLANDGEQGLARLAEGAYGLVLMDCQMPVLDGYEATRILRSGVREGADPTTPIVALTAHALAEERARCFEVGMDGFLAKPVGLDDLRTAIEDYGRVTTAS